MATIIRTEALYTWAITLLRVFFFFFTRQVSEILFCPLAPQTASFTLQTMRFVWLSLSLLFALIGTSRSEPTLSAIRDTLSAYESSIIHLFLTSRVLSNATQSSAPAASKEPFTLMDQNHDKQDYIGPLPFSSFASVVSYNRTTKEARRWGDSSNHYPHNISLSSYIESKHAAPTINMAEWMVVQTLLQSVSERCLLGTKVALAKLSAATKTSPLCVALKNKSRVAIRNALTNTTQEEAVRSSVSSKVNLWTGNTTCVKNDVVGLFNVMIAVTTDIEVATLMKEDSHGRIEQCNN